MNDLQIISFLPASSSVPNMKVGFTISASPTINMSVPIALQAVIGIFKMRRLNKMAKMRQEWQIVPASPSGSTKAQ